MALEDALKNLKYDVRMLEINLNNGSLTQEEIREHLKTLSDCATNCEPVSLEDRKDNLGSH